MKAIVHALASLLLVAAGAAQAQAQEPLKVGFVYVGPISDAGWTYEHDRARKMLEAELGERVETMYVESVDEGPDALRVIRQLAQTNDLVFTTSFGYMNPTIRVARNFPDTIFEHATGYKTADNVGTYNARWYQARYLTGLIAGSLTESNIIGYVAAYPIPEVIRGINAFTIGLREIAPEAEVRVVFTNSWYDPGTERQAAETLVNQGADILSKHQDSAAVIQVAAEHGLYAFGYDSDQKAFGPETVLTSIVNNWGPYYIETAREVINGTWEPERTWGGLASDMIYLAELHPVIPDDIVALVEKRTRQIESGEFEVFTGPLETQDGELVVAEGESLDDAELLRMDYFIEGVRGRLPE